MRKGICKLVLVLLAAINFEPLLACNLHPGKTHEQWLEEMNYNAGQARINTQFADDFFKSASDKKELPAQDVRPTENPLPVQQD